MTSSKILVVTICPGCLDRYPPNTLDADYPICPDCNSEAAEIEVIPYEDFIERFSLAEFEQMKNQWSRREGLLPTFKQAVLDRVDEIIGDKKGRRV